MHAVVRCFATGLALLALVSAGQAAGASLAPELAAGIASGAAQRVIVHVRDTPDAKTVLGPIPGPADRRRLEAVRDALRTAEAGLAAEIGPDEMVVHRRFRLQPAFAAEVSAHALRQLLDQPLVTAVEPDRRWRPLTFEGLQVIGADVLHGQGIAGEGTAVAVIDSGIDYLHPTLGGGQIPNAKVVHGLDLGDDDDDPMDCSGHGTAVASVAAGSSHQWSPNRRFAGGVAPAAQILAYKVIADEDCSVALTSSVVAAIEDAVLHRDGDGYRLAAINISLGGGAYPGPCDADNPAYSHAVRLATEAGIVVVAAAGNSGATDALSVPACLNDVVAVGSVWDTDPGLVGYSFCLNPDCTSYCDDSFRWQRAVTCYSNSSPSLDLLAPSEYLRAAARDAVMVDFGGTSGAAAYVSGAVALLAQAIPGLTPGTARHLLRATGDPVMDDKNGLIRPVVDLAAAVEGADRVFVAQDHAVPIGPRSTSPTVSAVDVAWSGSVGSVAVTVDLVDPDPSQLRLSLTSPDGTTAVIHDGAVEPGAAYGGGIAATYPNDHEPVDSLGRFAGRPGAGVWTLTIDNNRSASAPGDAPILLGWSLAFEAPDVPDPDATTLVFPVVAHADGVHGTSWRSDVRLFNAQPDRDTKVRLFLSEAPTENVFGIRQTDVVVPHGSIVALDDLVSRRFGLDGARGALVVEDPTGAVTHGTSRIYTQSEVGTYGQFVPPALYGASSTGAGEPPVVVLPILGPDHRVNLGITEVAGAPATVAVTLIDAASGQTLGPSTFHTVGSHRNLQLNGILPDGQSAVATHAYAEVTVVQGEGRVVAYASVVDNRTGDAVFVGGSKRAVTSSLLIPAVARTRGHADTTWQSDVRVLNHGSFTVHVDAELRFQGAFGLPPVVATLELQPGEAATLDDIVGTLFGFDEVVASLRLVPREGPAALCATSRTANYSPSGTYGQYIPALTADAGLDGTGTVLHVSKSESSRTNLGILETSGGVVDLELRLIDRLGRGLGSPLSVSLGPWDSVQLNDVFAALEAPAVLSARVEVKRLSGTGRFFAYASVVDADSGDAIFVPIVPTAEPLTN